MTPVKLQMFGGVTCHVHVKVDHLPGSRKQQTKIAIAARAQTPNRFQIIIIGASNSLS